MFRKPWATPIEMPGLPERLEVLITRARRLADGKQGPPDEIVSVSVEGSFNGWDNYAIHRALDIVCELAKTPLEAEASGAKLSETVRI